MSGLESFECSDRSESFVAYAESVAAEVGACSPACHSAVAGYD